MPHIIIDCTENIIKQQPPQKVLNAVFEAAFATALFGKKAIKVRMNPFQYSLTQDESQDFIHVFAHIMEGRTTPQKQQLSKNIVSVLTELYPNIDIISVQINDIEKATYCNKNLI